MHKSTLQALIEKIINHNYDVEADVLTMYAVFTYYLKNTSKGMRTEFKVQEASHVNVCVASLVCTESSLYSLIGDFIMIWRLIKDFKSKIYLVQVLIMI